MLEKTVTSRMIKKARFEAGLTQEQLAEIIFVSKQAVSNWERGINLPDEGIREYIEKALNIKLRDETMNEKQFTQHAGKIPDLKPLETLDTLESVLSSIDCLVDAIKVDSFEIVVKKMLTMTLGVTLGYEIYYQKYCRKFYVEEPLDWATTASDLKSLINDFDDWFIGKRSSFAQTHTMFANKIELMCDEIGSELFEDFDDNGFRQGFEQQVGRYGQDCGYDLLNLIPDSNTDIMVIYKSAVMDLADFLLDDSLNE